MSAFTEPLVLRDPSFPLTCPKVHGGLQIDDDTTLDTHLDVTI